MNSEILIVDPPMERDLEEIAASLALENCERLLGQIRSFTPEVKVTTTGVCFARVSKRFVSSGRAVYEKHPTMGHVKTARFNHALSRELLFYTRNSLDLVLDGYGLQMNLYGLRAMGNILQGILTEKMIE